MPRPDIRRAPTVATAEALLKDTHGRLFDETGRSVQRSEGP